MARVRVDFVRIRFDSSFRSYRESDKSERVAKGSVILRKNNRSEFHTSREIAGERNLASHLPPSTLLHDMTSISSYSTRARPPNPLAADPEWVHRRVLSLSSFIPHFLSS